MGVKITRVPADGKDDGLITVKDLEYGELAEIVSTGSGYTGAIVARYYGGEGYGLIVVDDNGRDAPPFRVCWDSPVTVKLRRLPKGQGVQIVND